MKPAVGLVDQLTRPKGVSLMDMDGDRMIDVDQLERAVDDAPGDAIAVTKAQLGQMLTEIRAGQAARRSLINLQSMITVSAATSGMRVPHGYRGPRPVPNP